MEGLTKEQRKQNLMMLKAFDEVDIEAAKEIVSDINLDTKELSTVIQDTILLPEGHPLKLSSELTMKGLQQLFLKTCHNFDRDNLQLSKKFKMGEIALDDENGLANKTIYPDNL